MSSSIYSNFSLFSLEINFSAAPVPTSARIKFSSISSRASLSKRFDVRAFAIPDPNNEEVLDRPMPNLENQLLKT